MTVSLTKAYFIAMFCEAILHGESFPLNTHVPANPDTYWTGVTGMYTVLTGGALYLLL